MKGYFITGIGTNIGKTIVSAILTEALQADYWKPIQAGELENSDSKFVQSMISNARTVVHPEAYKLKTPASPHLAARIDGVNISLNDIRMPKTNNTMIVEGAGGLLVPINHNGDLMADLIKHLALETIIVSQHYLGSINHTLLTVEALRTRNILIKGILFNGAENKESQDIICNITGLKALGHIPQLNPINKQNILDLAKRISL